MEHRKKHISICKSSLREATWDGKKWFYDTYQELMRLFLSKAPEPWLADIFHDMIKSPSLKAPSTVSKDPSARQYLWGNMPAIDVLKLRENEGEIYGRDLHVLFAGKSLAQQFDLIVNVAC